MKNSNIVFGIVNIFYIIMTIFEFSVLIKNKNNKRKEGNTEKTQKKPSEGNNETGQN